MNNTFFQHALISRIFNQHKRNTDEASVTLSDTGSFIYQQNYVENGIRALSLSYNHVERCVGEDNFRMLARNYLFNYPKTVFDWGEYGELFPNYLASIKDRGLPPFLPDLASIEWLKHLAERAKDIIFDAQSFHLLESEDPSNLEFILAPGYALTYVTSPIIDIKQWIQAVDKVQKDTLKERVKFAIQQPSSRSILTWRAEYKAQHIEVESEYAIVYEHLSKIKNVQAILTLIANHDIDLTEWLTHAISARIIFAINNKENVV